MKRRKGAERVQMAGGGDGLGKGARLTGGGVQLCIVLNYFYL